MEGAVRRPANARPDTRPRLRVGHGQGPGLHLPRGRVAALFQPPLLPLLVAGVIREPHGGVALERGAAVAMHLVVGQIDPLEGRREDVAADQAVDLVGARKPGSRTKSRSRSGRCIAGG